MAVHCHCHCDLTEACSLVRSTMLEVLTVIEKYFNNGGSSAAPAVRVY
jgi:hypothetical protein